MKFTAYDSRHSAHETAVYKEPTINSMEPTMKQKLTVAISVPRPDAPFHPTLDDFSAIKEAAFKQHTSIPLGSCFYKMLRKVCC